MSKVIKWALINGLFALAIYAGFVREIDGARNIAMFFAWLNIIFSFFMLADPVIEKMREKGRSIPKTIDIIFDLCVTSAFVWFGAWLTGIFWIVQLVLHEAAWGRADDTDESKDMPEETEE